MTKKKKYTVEYSSNNSGGHWWLTTEQWINLEKAGWEVIWGGYKFCKGGNVRDGCSKEECSGHKRFNSFKEMTKRDTWLDSYATDASVQADSLEDAIAQWEDITGENSKAQGCHCCGQPHNFNAEEN